MLITNLTTKKFDKKLLEKIAKKILLPKNKEEFSDLSIVLAEKAKIREINKKYRKMDKPTDILSFSELSEIFICLSVVEEQAKNLKTAFENELTRVTAHGILHLLGFDHGTKGQALKMEAKEKEILKKISEK